MLRVISRSTSGWPEWLKKYYVKKPADVFKLGSVAFDLTLIPVSCSQHAVCGFIDSQNKKYNYFKDGNSNLNNNMLISNAVSNMRHFVNSHPIKKEVQHKALLDMIKNIKLSNNYSSEFYWDWGLTRKVPAILSFKNGVWNIYIKTVNRELDREFGVR